MARQRVATHFNVVFTLDSLSSAILSADPSNAKDKKPMPRKRFVPAVVACFLLAGCGSTQEDRALSGAGIGASAGAVLGAVTGMSLLQGVVLGGASGAAVGAFTDRSTIDLGEPIWASSSRPANKPAVSRVQSALDDLGYEPGPADGVMGPRTSNAIRSYQANHALPIDGQPTAKLARHIEAQMQLASRD